MFYLYDDRTHDTSVLYSRLRDDFGEAKVVRCDAADILMGCLKPGSDVLIMPGGKDLNYCKDLNGRGIAIQKEFVKSGGGWLGICAGSCFGSTWVDWEPDTYRSFSGPRDLRFVNCLASGPVPEFIESIDGCWFNAAEISFGDNTFSALYSGGPVFKVNGDCDIMARYTQLPGSPPSIVGSRYGRGYAILCSPHLEADAGEFASRILHTNPAYNRLRRVADILMTSKDKQKAAWDDIMKRLINRFDI